MHLKKGCGLMKETIRLSKIVIPDSFKRSNPMEIKLDYVRDYVKNHGELDKPIVLNGNMLVDNYVRYLVAKELGFREVPCISSKEYRDRKNVIEMPATYIAAEFKDNPKEYIWRVPNGISVEVGDMVLVKSKFKDDNKAVVTVGRVFQSDDVDMLKHKTVIKKLRKKC